LFISVYIQVKQHVKDPQLLPTIKKWFAYHLEKQYQKDPESSIVLLFDLDGAGMAQIVSETHAVISNDSIRQVQLYQMQSCYFCISKLPSRLLSRLFIW
jgi:hypothetical protein